MKIRGHKASKSGWTREDVRKKWHLNYILQGEESSYRRQKSIMAARTTCAKVWRHRASKSPRWLVGKRKPTRARAGGILASSGKSWGTAESFHVDRIRFASSRRAGDGFGFGT